jgi:cysteine-rich repeat protein
MRPQLRICHLWLLPTLLLLACGDDPGPGNANANANQNTNLGPLCGDGVREDPEACDSGDENSDLAPDACRTNCVLPTCGDHVIDSGEACDDGPFNSDHTPDACRPGCVLPACGDGVVDGDESCDDGGLEAGDGCSGHCDLEPGWTCAGAPSVCRCRDFFGGDGCSRCVVHVDRHAPAGGSGDGLSWSTAFTDLEDALAAMAGLGRSCEVWVAAGTYYPYAGDRADGFHLRTGAHLYGGFAGDETARDQRDPTANETVLQGFGQSYHVVRAEGVKDVLLDGFTITGGRADGAAPQHRGGGLFVWASEVTVEGCTLAENAAEEGGAVAAVLSHLVLRNTRLTGNGPPLVSPCPWFACDPDDRPKGGALLALQSEVEVNGCEISDNVSELGGGVYLGASTVQIDDTGLERNVGVQGGAVYSYGDLVIRRSTIAENQAEWGGGVIKWGPLTLDAVVVRDNRAGRTGGGVYAGMGETEIVNCLIHGNDVDAYPTILMGTALHLESEAVRLLNCTVTANGAASGESALLNTATPEAVQVINSIVWGNATEDGESDIAGNDVTARYSVINLWKRFPSERRILPSGPGNLNRDPGFVDPASRDFRLRADSPCVDAGLGGSAPATDLEGNPRYNFPGVQHWGAGTPAYVDIGALELQGGCPSGGCDPGETLLTCSADCPGACVDPVCDLHPQCKCPGGQKCSLQGTARVCTIAGTGGAGHPCTADTDCDRGFDCVNAGSVSVCMQYCSGTGACAGGRGALCLFDLLSGGNPIPGARICSIACEPVSSTGCPAGQACRLGYNSSSGLCFTDCWGGVGTSTGACDTTSQFCPRGWFCSSASGNLCRKYCLRDEDCQGVGSGVCTTGTWWDIDGWIYGLCE